jgi:hypothetical protein
MSQRHKGAFAAIFPESQRSQPFRKSSVAGVRSNVRNHINVKCGPNFRGGLVGDKQGRSAPAHEDDLAQEWAQPFAAFVRSSTLEFGITRRM